MTINNKFKPNQIVYLKTDPEQLTRMVTAITVRGNNLIYELTFSDEMPSWHQEVEISDEEDTLKKVK